MIELEKLKTVCESIDSYTLKYAREPHSVQLIAVSKTRSAEAVLSLHQAGQARFGENYLQEALDKIDALKAHAIEWHFIGAIQSKKAAQIATHFNWVHSLDRLKVAHKLNQHRAADVPLNVLIQVNLEAESSKGGVAPNELPALAESVSALQNLRLRGLMFMPRVHVDFADQRAVFHQAKLIFDQLQKNHPHIDHLSMGMSADMQAAIAEGATMVRVGTALFGARAGKQSSAQTVNNQA